jgi:transposase-like protein
MDTYPIELPARRRRRRHSAAFKAAVIEACNQPGVSIAAVALANGLNANLLRKWVQRAERDEVSESGECPFHHPSSDPSPAFVPLALPAPAAPSEIRVEVKRPGVTVSVTWPTSAAADCALWLRELLR